ncbi:hypothetical protein HMPREF1544_04293 [Mucor circinelloides 1006PhL]|uniref:Stress-activated map kinase-interacting protein 1 n=1 Tax=Mucor circinelloides f. circinelloides (strain 1006PhL) TaxID=1220926 RepID=S2K164_MUCC1|nr:hypothetical protein HMPREF1544_04293 [Mucor circinelloides 1006PhL]
MSLINDPLYLIHISRIKFLRMDERGERIISFPPTVMSDDYVRLAAPVYPEMQYCYSPVYDTFLNNEGHVTATNISSSPRTTKRNYRQRKPMTNIPNMRYNQFIAPGVVGAGGGNAAAAAAMVAGHAVSSKAHESTTDSEDDDIEVDKQSLSSNSGKPVGHDLISPVAAAAGPLTIGVATSATKNTPSSSAGPSTATVQRSFPNTSLHPSVDSAIDPSPRSSIDDNAHPAFTALTPHTVIDVEETTTANDQPLPSSATTVQPTANIPPAPPLEYTKKDLAVTSKPKASALSALIAEKATAAENPFAEYSFVSGKGESKSIKLCVYLPTSNKPYTPVYLVVRPDAITDDVIGYILYDYVEQKREPELDEAAYDLAEWVLLIAEDDGEIEDDLPAIDRTRNIGRVSFDQFALCRATPSQAKQNDIDRAKMGRSKPDLETLRKKKAAMASPFAPAATTQQRQSEDHHHSQAQSADNNDAAHFEMSPPYANMTSDESVAQTYTTHLMQQQQHPEPDASTVAVPVPSSKATLTKATMPMKPLKDFKIKLMTSDEVSATTSIPVYADMFIGDVLELVSRKRKLDPNQYMLTIGDSNIIVQNDTTVESLKGITDLTFTKKNTALSVPTSSTHLWRSPIKRKKDEANHPMYFSTTESPTAGPSAANATEGLFSQYKKYNVSRKMPMFVSKRVYVLAIDGDYIHLMPPENKGMWDSVKTTSFHASAVRSCKQSKKVPTNFKIVILKERDFKTYDLEAESAKEANEICARIRLLMQVTKGV